MGAHRTVIERIKETGDIFWAQSDRNWILDGATVHVSMVGFDSGQERQRLLDGKPVDVIHENLTSSVNVTKAERLEENAGLAFIGSQKGGSFDIEPKLANKMLQRGGNPDGRSNADVVRPWINGSDIIKRSRGMYIIDFGVDMPMSEVALYEMPIEHVREYVIPKREKTKSESRTTEQWWLHQRPRPEMRDALEGQTMYIATPRVSKHRLFVWKPSRVLSDSVVVVIARDDDYFLGILHSRLHETWSRGTGTQLREASSGFRYSQTMTFEIFPFPWPPGYEPADDPRVESITQAARELVEKRQAWLHPEEAGEKELKKRTLTNLYNEYPTWLELVHSKLDRVMLDAYGWPHDLADEEILERLLELNLERVQAQKSNG